MKKKIMSLIALSLVGTMMVTSLTGCGLQTKATDITVDDGDTIIVDQEDMETEETEPETDVADTEDTNTEDTNSDEITGEEVVGDDTEANDFMGAEDENIVLYAEAGKQEYIPLSDSEYYEDTKMFSSATEDVPLYNGNGNRVGYIKKGQTVVATEQSETMYWSRLENPIKGTDYDYLYVINDYILQSDNNVTITPSDLKQRVLDSLNNLADPNLIIMDTPTDDMEVYEFRMNSVYDTEMDYTFWYEKLLKSDTDVFYTYTTYAIECEEDTDGWIICKLYYKDKAVIE